MNLPPTALLVDSAPKCYLHVSCMVCGALPQDVSICDRQTAVHLICPVLDDPLILFWVEYSSSPTRSIGGGENRGADEMVDPTTSV